MNRLVNAQEALDNFPTLDIAKKEAEKRGLNKILSTEDYTQIVWRIYMVMIVKWSKQYKKDSGLTDKLINTFKIW